MITNNNEEMSMLEVAEQLIQRKIKPQKFDKIAKEVCEIMGISDKEFEDSVAQFYSDLTLSGKFVTVGEDKWDLKSRQKYEVANYDTYDIEFDEEEVTIDDDFESIEADDQKLDSGNKDDNEDYDSDAKKNEDDYSDESDAEVSKDEDNELEGLSIYHEDDME